MLPERFLRIRQIVAEAMEAPPDQRFRLVAEACGGDEELLAEAEDLLQQRTNLSLLRSPLAGAVIDVVATEQLRTSDPARIGPYTLLSVLGEGGMGVVYLASQEEPIRRKVALKLIQEGSVGSQVLQRFESERQTLALMEHPGIARVLDAGSHPDGRPYFVMELVLGEPITDYCRSRGLGLRERLDLIRSVCRSVQHAHQKGIIHRDLKPSNILVADLESGPAPKVIDFGIAKALEAGESPGSEGITREGQLIGTLAAMSPEQAQGSVTRIDTRTDVYSLGLVLYQLISDRMPYEIAGLPLLEVVRVICEQAPAPLRGAATGAEDVDEDLETVVRKALEKSPDDRYSSAAALADDIDRYLLLQPILARPPSTMYQLRKLVQRHRGTTILVSAMLFLLLGFGVTMSLLYGSQNTQRRRAEAERARSEQTAKFLQDLLTPEEQGPGGADVRIRDVLAMAGPRIQLGLADHPGLRAGILNIMGNLYEGLGLHDQAEEHLRAALSLHEELWGRVHPEVGRDLRDLGRFLRAKGDYEGAGRYLEESLAILRRVHGGNHPDVAWSMEELARVRELRGDFAGAVTLLRGSVAIRSRQLPEGHDLRIGPETQLGRCLLAIGKTTEAESILVRTWRAAERSSPSSPPKRRDLLVALVDLYEQTGRPEAASRYEAALGQIPIGPPPWMERPGPGPRPEPGQGPPGADRRPQTQGR